MPTKATLDWQTTWQRQREEQNTRIAADAAVARKRLRAAGVKRVFLHYTGSNDSSDSWEITVEPAVHDELLSQPLHLVESPSATQMAEAVVEGLARPSHHEHVRTIRDAVSDYMDGKLDAEHGGWENNAGGSGTIVYDMKTGEVEVDHTYGGQGCDDDY
jgi:hypothetical protein